MKFATVLRDSAAVLPGTEDLFKKYKQLKKSLKRMPHGPHGNESIDRSNHPSAVEDSPSSSSGAAELHAPKRTKHEEKDKGMQKDQEAQLGEIHFQEQADADQADQGLNDSSVRYLDPALEAEFLKAITADVMELNERYIEKEEDCVIKYEQLEEQAKAADGEAAKTEAHRAFVDFHGDLLMLLHWSILAYTSLVKILKKHRKRTGAPLHAPHLENLLAQPFCSVEVTCDMIRNAEEWVARLANDLAPTQTAAQDQEAIRRKGEDCVRGASETMTSPPDDGSQLPLSEKGNGLLSAKANIPDSQALQRARTALRVWQQLQSNVSSPSTRIAATGEPLPGIVRVAELARGSEMTKSSMV